MVAYTGFMIPGLEEKRLSSYDGTDLCYYTGGSGPAVILANGLGGPIGSYRHIVSQLGPDYKVLTWDYRGLYGSGRPADLAAVSMDHQIRDLELLMAAEGIDNAILVGWSMGVQVAFEFCQRHPSSVAGLVMLCGVAGSPFRTLRGLPMAHRVVPSMMSLGRRNAQAVSQVGRRLTQWRGLVPLMQRLGVVAPRLDSDVFREITSAFASLDVEVYCETLRQLGEHDAYCTLKDIRVPTLLVAGDKDLMTPRRVSERMQGEIDNCRLVVVPGGTHYTPVEFPEMIAAELDVFLRGIVGFEPAACRQRRS